jgi:hypothetical protein
VTERENDAPSPRAHTHSHAPTRDHRVIGDDWRLSPFSASSPAACTKNNDAFDAVVRGFFLKKSLLLF